MSDYLMRSLMFVPSHNSEFMDRASVSMADVLLLDIEDSVQPICNKQVARDNIVKYVNDHKFDNYLIFPRVNDRESGELLKDIHQLTIEGVCGFMYPKSRDSNDIYFIDKLLETIEFEKGITPGTFKLIPLIETTSAVLNAESICKSSDRVVAIAFGCEDFIADLEGIHDADHNTLFVPRSIIAMAARSAGVIPVDTVHINVHDLVDLENNLKISKNLGFEGMLALNPKEIDIIHRYFSPSDDEVRNAIEIIELFEKSKDESRGVSIVGGKFIGPPMVLSAKKVIHRYELVQRFNNK